VDAEGGGDLVGADEADAGDVVGQAVGVGVDDLDGGAAVAFADADGQVDGDVVFLEEGDYLA